MPQIPEGAVDVTVRLHREIYEELRGWTRSAFDEDPEGFLALFVNALMTDQALREQVAGIYLGGA